MEKVDCLLMQKDDVPQREILNVIQTMLQDRIYVEFGYEIEDIESKIEQIRYNTTKRDKLRNKMQKQISSLLENSCESKKGNESGQEINGERNLEKRQKISTKIEF